MAGWLSRRRFYLLLSRQLSLARRAHHLCCLRTLHTHSPHCWLRTLARRGSRSTPLTGWVRSIAAFLACHMGWRALSLAARHKTPPFRDCRGNDVTRHCGDILDVFKQATWTWPLRPTPALPHPLSRLSRTSEQDKQEDAVCDASTCHANTRGMAPHCTRHALSFSPPLPLHSQHNLPPLLISLHTACLAPFTALHPMGWLLQFALIGYTGLRPFHSLDGLQLKAGLWASHLCWIRTWQPG